MRNKEEAMIALKTDPELRDQAAMAAIDQLGHKIPCCRCGSTRLHRSDAFHSDKGVTVNCFCQDCGNVFHAVMGNLEITDVNKITKLDKGRVQDGQTRINPMGLLNRWWWLAINGPSVSASSEAFQKVMAKPTPEWMIGFRTQDEQARAQKKLLHSSGTVLRRFVEELKRRNDVKIVVCKHPEPPTHGLTEWYPS